MKFQFNLFKLIVLFALLLFLACASLAQSQPDTLLVTNAHIQRTEANDGVAQYQLEECYHPSYSIAQNWETMVYWYDKSSAQLYLPTVHSFSKCFRESLDVMQDAAISFKLVHFGAKDGYAKSIILSDLLTGYDKKNDSQKQSMTCENYILTIAANINRATREGDDAKALQLASIVFNYFSEQGVLAEVSYGPIDNDDKIAYTAYIPSSFPTKIEKDINGEIVTYSVDLIALRRIVSQDGIYEYVVVISPWTGIPLFKIKISEEFLFLWTIE